MDILVESQSFTVTALNESDNADYTMPEKYSKLVGVIYDNSVGVLFDIKSQRAKQNILLGYNTRTPGMAFLPLFLTQADQEVLKFAWQFKSLGPNVAAYWNGVAGVIVQENSFPYTMTFTFLYGR